MGVVYPEIEQRLLNVQLTHPRGNPHRCEENNGKWRKVLYQYLVDKKTMKAINGDSW